MDWFQFLMLLLVTIVGSILSWWLPRISARIDARDEERIKHEQNIIDRITQLENALLELHGRLDTQVGKEQERLAIEEMRMDEFLLFREGIKAVLRDRLLQARRYFCGLGYIPAQEFENISAIHEAYNKLHGNNLGDKAFEEIKSLPFEPQIKEG